MKIAFVSRWFVEEHKRTGCGGSEQQRVKGYINAGHEVVVLSQEEGSGQLEAREINGIKVVTTDRWKRLWWLAMLDKLAKGWSHHRKIFTDAWALHLFLKKFGPFDVLEAQCEEPDGLVAAVCALFTKMPPWCIQLFALRYSFKGAEPQFEQTRSLGFAFRRAGLVKANSQLVAECLVKEYGCPSEKILVVHPNLENPRRPSQPLNPSRPYVLCVGALTRTKGIETFVRAAELVSRENVHCAVVGGAGSDPAYSEKVKSLPGSAKINWLGELPRDELHAHMASADVVVIPSWFDAWNRAAIESIALGRPVVVTDRCGAAEWIKHHCAGVVVPAGNAEALVEGIKKVLQDERYRKAAENAASIACRDFSVEEITRQNLEVFRSLKKDQG